MVQLNPLTKLKCAANFSNTGTKVDQSFLITSALPFVVAVVTVGIATVGVSGQQPLEPLAFVSTSAASSEALVADEDAWQPIASAAPQTAYAQEGLAGLTCAHVSIYMKDNRTMQ